MQNLPHAESDTAESQPVRQFLVAKQIRLDNAVMEAANHFPHGQLAISPQCGFGTSIVGNRLTIDEQNTKLRIVAETAQNVWG